MGIRNMLELSPVRQKELHKNISRTPRSIKKGEVRKNERKKNVSNNPKTNKFYGYDSTILVLYDSAVWLYNG